MERYSLSGPIGSLTCRLPLFFVRCRRRSKYCLKCQSTSFTQNKTLNNGSENTIHYTGVPKQGHDNKIFLFNIILSIIEQSIVN